MKYIRRIDRGTKTITRVDEAGNAATEVVRDIEDSLFTDAEIIDEIPAQLQITCDRAHVLGDGVDTIRVTVALVSAALNDDSQVRLMRPDAAVLWVDDVLHLVQLDDEGQTVIEITAVEVEAVTIEPYSHAGNALRIEVVQ
jgi:hypothetical protein